MSQKVSAYSSLLHSSGVSERRWGISFKYVLHYPRRRGHKVQRIDGDRKRSSLPGTQQKGELVALERGALRWFFYNVITRAAAACEGIIDDSRHPLPREGGKIVSWKLRAA